MSKEVCKECPYREQTIGEKVNEVRDYIYETLEKLGFPKYMTPKKYNYYQTFRRMIALSHDIEPDNARCGKDSGRDIVRELLQKGYTVFDIKLTVSNIYNFINSERSSR